MARAMNAMANHHISCEPPDYAAALICCDEAIRLGEMHSPSFTIWALATRAGTLQRNGSSETTAAIREAISRSHDARLWMATDLALSICVTYLLAGSPDVAARLLGHINRRPQFVVGFTARFREVQKAAVAEMTNGAELMAVGAAMGRHEAVEYALAELDGLEMQEDVAQ